MGHKAVSVREDDDMATATLVRRVSWVVGAGLWAFLVVGMASFDTADWPSHAVAVHNDPPHNLCGPVGALIAWWSYAIIGIGTWVILAGIAGYLVLTAGARTVGHPFVRMAGLLLMALAVSGFHGLFAARFEAIGGILPGTPGGLLAFAAVNELTARFSDVGTLLLLTAGLAVGAVVAVDRLVMAIPAAKTATALTSSAAKKSGQHRFSRTKIARPVELLDAHFYDVRKLHAAGRRRDATRRVHIFARFHLIGIGGAVKKRGGHPVLT